MTDKALARKTDPDTSHDAADSIEDVTKMEAIAAEAVLSMGQDGCNGDDLCRITGLPWQTITPRLRPLLKKGIIYHRLGSNGQWLKRMGKSGRMQLLHFHSSLRAW